MSKNILLLFLIIMFTTSCTGFKSDPIIITEREYITPSRAGMQEYKKPKIQIEIDADGYLTTTNRELLKIILEQAEIIDFHNQDKKFLKEWEESIPNKTIIKEGE